MQCKNLVKLVQYQLLQHIVHQWCRNYKLYQKQTDRLRMRAAKSLLLFASSLSEQWCRTIVPLLNRHCLDIQMLLKCRLDNSCLQNVYGYN